MAMAGSSMSAALQLPADTNEHRLHAQTSCKSSRTKRASSVRSRPCPLLRRMWSQALWGHATTLCARPPSQLCSTACCCGALRCKKLPRRSPSNMATLQGQESEGRKQHLKHTSARVPLNPHPQEDCQRVTSCACCRLAKQTGKHGARTCLTHRVQIRHMPSAPCKTVCVCVCVRACARTCARHAPHLCR
jgi:hypothetical protein